MPSTCQPSTNTEGGSKRFVCQPSNQGSSLLEEWLCNDSALHCSRKEVSFSEYSELRLYNTNRSYESKKSYSAADTKSFQVQAASDASCIRKLISSHPIHTGRAIKYALDLGWIKQEELAGIEHLLSEKAAANLVHQRRVHVASVLRAQHLMQEKYENGVDNVMLPKIASRLSSMSVKKAGVRATWSMIDGNEQIALYSST
eukprot:CCRYP_020973-RA/>CCRYP_020973-RA protein AED:0.23 eAED:0.23 QI:0/-1/0/1/-1/1/1/0/200